MKKLTQINLYTEGWLKGFGPPGLEKDPGSAGTVFNNFISAVIGLMTIIAVIYFTILLISGAYAMMSAGGDSKKLQGAQTRISNGLIGLVVVISAIFVIKLIGWIFGIEMILNPAEFISTYKLGG